MIHKAPSESLREFGIVHRVILDLRKLNDEGYSTMYDGHQPSQFSAPDIARALIDTFSERMPRDEQEKYRPMTEYLGSLFPEACHISIFEADQMTEDCEVTARLLGESSDEMERITA